MPKQSPDPRDQFVVFRLTKGERADLDRQRGASTVSEFLRRVLFRGDR